MNCCLAWFLAISALKIVAAQDVSEAVRKYFDSQIVQDFNTGWQKVRRSYENAVSLALKEAFGTSLQNVFVKEESPQLASGYFLSDNVVDLLMIKPTLRYHIPRLRPFAPEVNLALGDNLIRVNADLDQIFVEADYYLFRNKSDITFEGIEDPFKSSPFALDRVKKRGKLVIVAEECKLTGIATAMLKGLSVNLGYTSFQVTRCQFRIEIYKPGLSSPPVMAPYLSVEQGQMFERFLSKPISNEISPKLQGILFSMINTTSIFDLKVGEVRNYQRELSRKVNDYLTDIVAKMNDVTATTKGGGSVKMNDFELVWDDPADVDYPDESSIIFQNLVLNGLETAYSAQLGGVYRTNSIKIADEIRFQELQVRGRMLLENTTHKEVRDFTIELLGVAVSVKLSLDNTDVDAGRSSNRRRSTLRSPPAFALEVVGWRDLEYYMVSEADGPLHLASYIAAGYVINEVPRVINAFLNDALGQALGEKPSLPDYDDDPFDGARLRTHEKNQ